MKYGKIQRYVAVIAGAVMIGATFLVPVQPIHAVPAKSKASVHQAAVKKAEAPQVTLKFNGIQVKEQGLTQAGSVYVPISFLRDTLKMPFSYDKATKTYSIGQEYRKLKLVTSEYGISPDINGYYLYPLEAKNINGRLFVPFQWVKDYLGFQGEWNAASKTLNVSTRQENKLTVETESYNKDSKDVTIHLNTPQIRYPGNQNVEKAINDVLMNDLKQLKETIDKQLKEKNAEGNENPNPYGYSSSYLVTYNQNGVLGLVVESYEYTGGAHGMTYRQGYTFSLKDGKALTLDDLFGKNASYRKQLNLEIAKQFSKNPGYTGGFKELKKNPDFFLTPDTLHVFFQVYDYLPYAGGFPEFSFPFSKLLPKGSTPFDGLNAN